ncbi:MAG: class I SAM-dependent rRNA methyltransferase [Candidatus Promineifilaceae bacterium]
MHDHLPSVQLKSGREKPIANRHPWIFSGALEKISGEKPEPGAIVDVLDSNGHFLARGYINSESQISVRILTWDRSQEIDQDFWRSRIRRALNHRQDLRQEPETNAYRLIYAESDGLPGLIVDKYGDYLVVQLLTLGVDVRRDLLLAMLQEAVHPVGIIERSDAAVRRQEGLELVAEQRLGDPPPNFFSILENGIRFTVDLLKGQKTGFYLDQRDNRDRVCSSIHVEGRQILNAFSYTGGFGVYAAARGADKIVNVDASYEALELAERNIELNNLYRPDDEYIAGSAFDVLRHFRDTSRQFDMVILDPPKFARSRREINDACRGYKDLNWLALRLVRPGGILATFSCSGVVSTELFQKVVFGAAVDAGRDVQIMNVLGQPEDHPVLLTFPESAYLKGFLCRVH